jgi:hypothetical protein
MRARALQAVLAAAIQNPHWLARWQQTPEPLERLGVDPGSLDLTSLVKFAGLTVKVRHNGLRTLIPVTFRLLSMAGLEIELFSAYALFRATLGAAYANSSEERLADLIAYLPQWVDPRRVEHTLLWDLVRHEAALARLQRSNAAQPAAPTRKLRAQGQIVLAEMSSDPREVAAELRQSVPSLDRIAIAPHLWCYWRRDECTDILVLELDEFGYAALSRADGTRTPAQLSRELTGRERPTRAFLALLEELRSVGILGFA